MPYEQQPEELRPVHLENEPFKFDWQKIEDDYALELVNKTYWQCELDRTQNHDRRWSNHDSLYYSYVPPRVWDGTNVARSSFGYPIVFDQVEAALPQISNALFSNEDWFSVEAEPGTQPEEAKQIQDAMSYILTHPKDDVGSTCINEFKCAIKNILLYGNGGISVEWSATLQRPVVEWVDLRDFYVDPGLNAPNVDEGKCVIRRKFMSVNDLVELGKKDSRMKIPSPDQLWYMAKNVPQAPADQTKRVQEALRNVYYSPGFTDYLPLPSDQKVEVLVYYSKSRIIWVLDKKCIAYNGPNPYGFVPFCFAPCYIVPGRFYAMSIGDVQEHNQRYSESLFNNHLDELTLALHPPRVMNRKNFLTPAQQRWRPGAVFSGDSKDDVSLLQTQSATTNVFDEIQWIQVAAEKRTGINAMGQGSVPQPSNANRTLGGLQMQAGGSSSRLSEIVSNIENYLIVPTLYKLYKIMQMHTRPGQALPASAPQGDKYYVDSSITQKKINFRMLAASKMVTRDKLMQIVPFWMQVVSQGNLIDGLHQIGQTIDMNEVFRMLQDATGVAHVYNMVRPLSQQEQQQMQQPPPQAQLDMQKAQQETDTRKQIMQMKVQGDLQKEQIKKQPDFWQQQIDQNKAAMDSQAKQQELQQSAEQHRQEMQQKQLLALIDLHSKRQQHQLDLAKKQADVQMGMQQSHMQMQSAQAQHQMQMQQMIEQAMTQRAANQISLPEETGLGAAEKTSKPASGKRPLTKHDMSKVKPKAPSA